MAIAGFVFPPTQAEGYVFASEVVGGRIPKNLIPAVDKGVQEAMAEGFLAGYPMVDINCVVFDGSYHAVDSNEMAFKTAARLAFRAACEQADPHYFRAYGRYGYHCWRGVCRSCYG